MDYEKIIQELEEELVTAVSFYCSSNNKTRDAIEIDRLVSALYKLKKIHVPQQVEIPLPEEKAPEDNSWLVSK